ncbi:uncharacterized protein LOC126787313 [Argentina anserina]|uniref:uncharacterized protein LOC126787313 n=1 Tax=Argentina anserina TaxID=57926 RepID=UPI0021763F06|nr:uncharacterized protein LOC126787313 [Potentilla anserina]
MHERGIEVAEDKAKAVLDAPAPGNKKELQSLLGKINFLRRFISNSAGKTAVFSPLLKLKANQEFQWGPAQQAAFDKIKEYLTHPPVLRLLQPGIPLKLYISASPYSIAGLLAQDGDGEGGKKIEHAVYYLSQTLLEAETRYSRIERLCLALYFAGTKLRHYMLSFTTVVVAQTDLVKYMLTRPMLRGRIGKWILVLSEFFLQYTPLKALTGQAVSEFLLHHPISEDIEDQNLVVSFVHTQPWVLYFDGSSPDHLSRAGVALVNPSIARHWYSFQLEWKCTNNQAEYETIIIGLELLLDLEVIEVEVLGDSLQVINQLKAQLATGIRLVDGVRERILKVQRRTLPSFMARKEVKDDWLVAVIDVIDVDWRQPNIQYLTDPSAPVDKRVRYCATNYVFRGGELLRRAEDGLYLRCIYGAEAKKCLREDYISFAQGCIECQMHGPVQNVPDVPLQPIIKSWLGRSWALDFIGEIHPNSSLQHKHILLATDFFTKWVKAIPVKTTSSEVEASNRVIMFILKRMLDANPRSLHTELDHTLWAYRTSKRTPTGTTPYALMYGHDEILPIEINVQSLRVREQHQLIDEDYVQAMYQEHEDLDSRWMEALDSLIAENKKIARLYDKRTRGRNFGVGDLVWKACLPYGERVDGRGKWSTKWEGPFVIDRVMGRLEDIAHRRCNSSHRVSKEVRNEHEALIGFGPKFGCLLPDARRLKNVERGSGRAAISSLTNPAPGRAHNAGQFPSGELQRREDVRVE